MITMIKPALIARCAAMLCLSLLLLACGSDPAPTPTTAPAPTTAPLAPNTESLEIGGRVYYETCMTCHGVAGRGDGPGAAALESPPADLAVHVPMHPDADLFGFVSQGIAGTAMPAFGDRLTDDEIWHVVNYIKTFDE